MRFGKGFVGVLTALMMAAAILIAVKADERNTILPLTCEVSTPEGTEISSRSSSVSTPVPETMV